MNLEYSDPVFVSEPTENPLIRIIDIHANTLAEIPSCHDMCKIIIPKFGWTDDDIIYCRCKETGEIYRWNPDWVRYSKDYNADLRMLKKPDDEYDIKILTNRSAERMFQIKVQSKKDIPSSEEMYCKIIPDYKIHDGECIICKVLNTQDKYVFTMNDWMHSKELSDSLLPGCDYRRDWSVMSQYRIEDRLAPEGYEIIQLDPRKNIYEIEVDTIENIPTAKLIHDRRLDVATDALFCRCKDTGKIYEYHSDQGLWYLRKSKYVWNADNSEEKDTSSVDRTIEEFGSVTSLGSGNTKYPTDYDPDVLETFKNKHKDNDYIVSLDAYEFSSLCPKTHQPDFAKVVISYIPNEDMVESKSLKLYLFSFRQHGDFHEDCMNIIMKDLIRVMDPKYIEVRGIFAPRGGISIFPFTNWANPKFDYASFAKQRKLDALRDASNRTARFDIG